MIHYTLDVSKLEASDFLQALKDEAHTSYQGAMCCSCDLCQGLRRPKTLDKVALQAFLERQVKTSNSATLQTTYANLSIQRAHPDWFAALGLIAPTVGGVEE